MNGDNIKNRLPVISLTKDMCTKLIDNKLYISQKLLTYFFKQTVTFITKIKDRLMYMTDKIILIKDVLLRVYFY